MREQCPRTSVNKSIVSQNISQSECCVTEHQPMRQPYHRMSASQSVASYVSQQEHCHRTSANDRAVSQKKISQSEHNITQRHPMRGQHRKTSRCSCPMGSDWVGLLFSYGLDQLVRAYKLWSDEFRLTLFQSENKGG